MGSLVRWEYGLEGLDEGLDLNVFGSSDMGTNYLDAVWESFSRGIPGSRYFREASGLALETYGAFRGLSPRKDSFLYGVC